MPFLLPEIKMCEVSTCEVGMGGDSLRLFQKASLWPVAFDLRMFTCHALMPTRFMDYNTLFWPLELISNDQVIISQIARWLGLPAFLSWLSLLHRQGGENAFQARLRKHQLPHNSLG